MGDSIFYSYLQHGGRTGNRKNLAIATDSHVNPKLEWVNNASCVHATSSDIGRHQLVLNIQDGGQ